MNTYRTGEFIQMGAEYAYVLLGDSRGILGITEDKEILLDLRSDIQAIHSLGLCESASMPTEDEAESGDDFDWEAWGLAVRFEIDCQGILI